MGKSRRDKKSVPERLESVVSAFHFGDAEMEDVKRFMREFLFFYSSDKLPKSAKAFYDFFDLESEFYGIIERGEFDLNTLHGFRDKFTRYTHKYAGVYPFNEINRLRSQYLDMHFYAVNAQASNTKGGIADDDPFGFRYMGTEFS